MNWRSCIDGSRGKKIISPVGYCLYLWRLYFSGAAGEGGGRVCVIAQHYKNEGEGEPERTNARSHRSTADVVDGIRPTKPRVDGGNILSGTRIGTAVRGPFSFGVCFKQNGANGSHLQGDASLGRAATALDLVRFSFVPRVKKKTYVAQFNFCWKCDAQPVPSLPAPRYPAAVANRRGCW